MAINLSVDFMLRTASSLTLNDIVHKSGYKSKAETMNAALVWAKAARNVIDDGCKFVAVEQDGKTCSVIDPEYLEDADYMDVGRYTALTNPQSAVILKHMFNGKSPATALTEALYLYDRVLDLKATGHRFGSYDPRDKKYSLLHVTYSGGQKLVF